MNLPDPADINSLLEPRPPTNRNSLILWIIVIGLALLFLPLYLASTVIENDSLRLQNDLGDIQIALANEPTPLPEVQELNNTIAQIQGQANEIEAIQSSLAANHIDWPLAMDSINDYDQAEMSLTSVTQTDNRVILEGRAVDDGVVIGYARQLDESGQFARVVVQSITLLPTPLATPTLTATVTVTPTAAATPDAQGETTPQPTTTPTPDLRDEFEDDTEPQPVFLSQPQAHNFYPTFDVDAVFFLAKAGRYYNVSTSNLAPGVDTFLTITYGDTILTNDDSKPGTLGSEIYFYAPADSDVEVVVQITNRGQYGPEMSYQLMVQEIVPTPTFTPTPEPTVSNDPTATPTPTMTPTPDLRDIYEPDDVTPAAIFIGPPQTHNFFPDGDVDRLSFPAKAGGHYRFVTSVLAPGVDTSMKVELYGEQWQNDDYAPGSNNLASAVCFPAAADGTAVVTISNLYWQFAPDKTYNISVAEVPELTVDPDPLDFGSVTEGGGPLTRTLSISGSDAVDWTAETDATWFNLDTTAATTPSTVSVSTESGLPAGSYEGTVTFSWATFCRQTVTVTLQINAPLFSSHFPLSPTYTQGQPDSVALSPLPMMNTGFARKPGIWSKPAFQNEAVEFVIVIELKTNSP